MAWPRIQIIYSLIIFILFGYAEAAMPPKIQVSGSVPKEVVGAETTKDMQANKFINPSDILTNIPWIDVSPSTVEGTDDAIAINAALASTDGPIGIRLAGKYTIKTPIIVSKDRVFIHGTGMYTTTLMFNPTISGGACIQYSKGITLPINSRLITQGGIGNLGFSGVGTKQKIAISLVDTSGVTVSNVASYPWTGNNGNPNTPSIGLQLKGREFTLTTNLYISADLPISIEDNPNNGIDIDHAHFMDTYLTTTDTTQYNVKIADGVNLSNVVFDGTNPWVKGAGALYWKSTTNTKVSFDLSISNLRFEQPSSYNGWFIYIDHNYSLQNLRLINAYGGGGSTPTTGVNGVFLKNINRGILENVMYTNSDPNKIALQLDGITDLATISCLWQVGGTLVLSKNVKEIFSVANKGHEPSPATAYYSIKTDNLREAIRFGGQLYYTASGSINPNSTTVLETSGITTGMFIITASSADYSVYSSGIVMVAGPINRSLLTSTENFTTNPDNGKKLEFVSSGGGNNSLINKLDQGMNYSVTYMGR